MNWLKCQRAMAEHLGWLDRYDEEPWRPEWEDASGRVWRTMGPPPNAHRGGREMRICLSADRDGWPRGATHRFRVDRRMTNELLADLAVGTRGDWGWMTDKNGRRVTRAAWLERAGLPAA